MSGDEEARLVYASAWRDFGAAGRTLAVLDVGGGSTELVVGDGPAPRGARERAARRGAPHRARSSRADPIRRPPSSLRSAPRRRPRWRASRSRRCGDPGRATLVGVAGTVTTLAAVERGLRVYDAGVVHGAVLSLDALERLHARLGAMTVAARAAAPRHGAEARRRHRRGLRDRDLEAMRAARFDRLTVSDRGVRWGLLYDRFARDTPEPRGAGAPPLAASCSAAAPGSTRR